MEKETAAGPKPPGMDLTQFRSPFSFGNKLARLLWKCAWLFAFRPSPRPFHPWRRFLLRLFGARIGKGVKVYGSARIWAPWNLMMGDYSVMGDAVDCYSVARIEVGAHAMVSQYAFLCTASHDDADPRLPLTRAPIRIGPSCWVAADAYIGPGVTVGEGSVVGARASVYKDVEPWIVVGGNPAKKLRDRVISTPGAPGPG